MDVAKLTQARAEAEKEFNELSEQLTSINKRLDELRGAYAAYTKLIDEAEKPIKPAKGKKG